MGKRLPNLSSGTPPTKYSRSRPSTDETVLNVARDRIGQDRQGNWARSSLSARYVPSRGRGKPDRSHLLGARDGWADRGGAPRSGLGRWKPEEGIQGSVVFIGSISSQGIPGQIAYASTKAGLEGAEATLTKEAIFHGVHAAIVHPGFTNTPMVRVLGEEYIKKNILPYTRLGRLIEPSEIAEAICFLISNSESAGSFGQTPAGIHPSEFKANRPQLACRRLDNTRHHCG